MLEFLKSLFSGDPFMPHIHCFLQNRELTFLHVASDGLIGISYVAISATLAYLVYRMRREVPFHSMFLAFGVFIIACGMTHFMEIWTLWTPAYWLSGGVKAVTAAASVITAIALPPLIPVAMKMIENAGLAEKRRAELEEAHRELAEAHGELEHLYARLKEFDELKTRFFANVSHELRTPLTLIIGPTNRLLASPGLTEEDRQSLETIRRNAQVLVRHVNDLLDIAKMESGEMQPRYAEVDLGYLVRMTAANFESLAQDRQIELDVTAADPVPAEVDPEKLQRILVNLLSNALKFTPEAGVVRLSLEVRTQAGGRRRAVIQVRDSGPGVPPEFRERIFERFGQVDGGATRRYEGTGLGLAIVKDFVALHGGTVRVDDAPEGGARFIVELPIAAPAGATVQSSLPAAPELAPVVLPERPSQPAGEPEPARSAPRAAAAAESRPTVLVVEDHPDLNRFIVETLSGEFHVLSARDGQEGLEKLLASPPDLVVSDLMMPRMSGDQLLQAIRSRPELNAVPVILLTAKADDEMRVNLLQEGAQDYVMKPFSGEELRARVGNLTSIKRAREVLQVELTGTLQSLEALAREVAARKRELEVAVESMRVARDHAERASQVKTNFLRLVSHELRTPLTAISLQLQLLQRHRADALSTKEHESLRKMSTAASRLQDLIESLLEHARIEAGHLSTEKAPLDLQALAAAVREEAELRAEQKELRLFLTAPPDLPPLESDRRLVRLVLANLVDNAIKFTAAGEVEIRLSAAEGRHRIAVRDTGAGIPRELHRTIFEPFEQLEPISRKHTPGVGLGLALVQEMVTALGGQIELASEPGRGSTFTVLLPSTQAA
jgi:signal transduction histidine kinase